MVKFRVITDAPKCVRSKENLMAEIHYQSLLMCRTIEPKDQEPGGIVCKIKNF
jgi:hypothetical protein